MLCVWPDGRITDPSGREVAHASLSARQAKGLGLMMSGTYGPPSTGSSSSVALSESLESRLRALTAGLGSTLYKLTWKHWDLPSGRQICALRASVPRTSGSGSISRAGWVTPTVRDWKDSPGMATVATNPDGSTRNRADQLPRQAALAGWPTPKQSDSKQSYTLQGAMNEAARKSPGNELSVTAMLLLPARLTDSGELLTGSTAGMESGGQYNPAHSRWLSGLPPVWDELGVTAMQSLPKSPRRSSKQ